VRLLLAFALAVLFASVSLAAGTLDVYVIDTEGGKAVILVTPAGGTMLIDAGYPRQDNRDTERIVATAQSLGIRQFDYIVSTHYDADHVGNVPEVAARIPARVYVDHGPPMSSGPGIDRFLNPYLHFIQGKKRVSVKPGDTIPMKGLHITVVSSGGEVLARPLKGAGKSNASCASTAKPDQPDLSENAASIGLSINSCALTIWSAPWIYSWSATTA
jgi:competence protein ComEC